MNISGNADISWNFSHNILGIFFPILNRNKQLWWTQTGEIRVTQTKGVTRSNLISIIAMKELSISPYVTKETARNICCKSLQPRYNEWRNRENCRLPWTELLNCGGIIEGPMPWRRIIDWESKNHPMELGESP